MSINNIVSNISPHGGLVLSRDGKIIYGISSNGNGRIFSVNIDGSNYQVIHTFNPLTDGKNPNGYLIFSLDYSTLYGTCVIGANSGEFGTIFSFNILTSIFITMHSFSNIEGNGPSLGLTLSLDGNTLYGSCINGGLGSSGTIFQFTILDNTFKLLYYLDGNVDGNQLNGNLILYNNILYGTCDGVGPSGHGSVFGLDISNISILPLSASSMNILYSFTGGNDGSAPRSGLTLNNNILYGQCFLGGSFNNGTFFEIDINNPPSSPLIPLYTFTGGIDGSGPQGRLAIYGRNIYGTCLHGGSLSNGTLFEINLNNIPSAPLTPLYTFGQNPDSGVVRNVNILYGVNSSNVFSFSLPLICFDSSTSILCLINNEEKYIPFRQLEKNILVKIYLKDNKYEYKEIDSIGYGEMINNPNKWNECMYELKNEKQDENLPFESLILTGGHSILVSSLTEDQEKKQKRNWRYNRMIEDKYLLLAHVNEKFEKIKNRNSYTYFHLILKSENKDERFGIWANGILTEICSKKTFKKINFPFLK